MAATDKDSARTGIVRWYMPTPGKLVALLLLSVIVLYLSDQFDWFAFNKQKGLTVLISVVVVAVGVMLLGLWAVAAYLVGRKTQFSLATLLVVIVAAALPCAWLAHEMRKARQLANTIKQFRQTGIHLSFDIMDSPLTNPTIVDPLEGISKRLRHVFSDEFFGDIGTVFLGDRGRLTEIKSLSRVRHVFAVEQAIIVDDDLDALANFPELETILFLDTEITDTGLAKLQKFRSLKSIFIGDSKVTADERDQFDRKFVGRCTIITSYIEPDERFPSHTEHRPPRSRGRHGRLEQYRSPPSVAPLVVPDGIAPDSVAPEPTERSALEEFLEI